MFHSSRGIGSAGKIGLVIAIALLFGATAYLDLGMGRPAGTSSTSRSGPSSTTSSIFGISGAAGVPRILYFFGNFSQVIVKTISYDAQFEVQSGSTITCTVLGRSVVNSTNYYRVRFTDTVGNATEIVWFNEMGGVDRVDAIGGSNYTGYGVANFAAPFLAAIAFIPQWSYNATLPSNMHKTSESMQAIGPTTMDVVTYQQAAPSSAFRNVTAKIGMVPGTSSTLAVYVYQQSSDGSESTFEIVSATRA